MKNLPRDKVRILCVDCKLYTNQSIRFTQEPPPLPGDRVIDAFAATGTASRGVEGCVGTGRGRSRCSLRVAARQPAGGRSAALGVATAVVGRWEPHHLHAGPRRWDALPHHGCGQGPRQDCSRLGLVREAASAQGGRGRATTRQQVACAALQNEGVLAPHGHERCGAATDAGSGAAAGSDVRVAVAAVDAAKRIEAGAAEAGSRGVKAQPRRCFREPSRRPGPC